jgi:hypothetical protein
MHVTRPTRMPPDHRAAMANSHIRRLRPWPSPRADDGPRGSRSPSLPGQACCCQPVARPLPKHSDIRTVCEQAEHWHPSSRVRKVIVICVNRSLKRWSIDEFDDSYHYNRQPRSLPNLHAVPQNRSATPTSVDRNAEDRARILRARRVEVPPIPRVHRQAAGFHRSPQQLTVGLLLCRRTGPPHGCARNYMVAQPNSDWVRPDTFSLGRRAAGSSPRSQAYCTVRVADSLRS